MTGDTPASSDPLVKVARDLTELEKLTADLPPQAVNDHAHPLMPGGPAMVMLAHIANLEAHGYIIDHAERANLDDGPGISLAHVDDEEDGWEPPLQTLLFWSEQWRVVHDMATDLRPTIAREAAFLRQVLEWAWENEPHFDDFAADIRAARVRLENALTAGRRAERTRVPCTQDDCKTQPRLIRVYGHTVRLDHYRCPSCKTRYDQSDFVRAKHIQLASEGAERFVRFGDAAGAIDRPERTIRKWITEGGVRSRRDQETRRLLVWWPDVRVMHQTTTRRHRIGSA